MTKILMLCCTALAPAAFAQTWVSASYGSDANNCTRAFPCLTFQRAASVTPIRGTLGVIDRGDYGGVVIFQDIIIDGGGLVTNLLSTNAGIVVQASAGQVVQIRNLSLVGYGATSPVGINFVSGGQLILDNVKVSGFTNCVNVGLSGGGYTDVVIKNSSINYCPGTGISIASSGPSLTAEITNTTVTYAANGLSANAGRLSLRESTFSSPNPGSGNIGLWFTGADVMVDNCQITRYNTGISASSLVELKGSTLSYNGTAVQTQGVGTILSSGTNAFFVNTVNGLVTLVGLQ